MGEFKAIVGIIDIEGIKLLILVVNSTLIA